MINDIKLAFDPKVLANAPIKSPRVNMALPDGLNPEIKVWESSRYPRWIAHRDFGDEKLPAIILTHDFLTDQTIWDGMIAGLTERYRVITWDSRSPLGKCPYDGADFSMSYELILDLMDLIEELELTKNLIHHLGAGRLGACLAYELAFRMNTEINLTYLLNPPMERPDLKRGRVFWNNFWKEWVKKGVLPIISESILPPKYVAQLRTYKDPVLWEDFFLSITHNCGVVNVPMDILKQWSELCVISSIGPDDPANVDGPTTPAREDFATAECPVGYLQMSGGRYPMLTRPDAFVKALYYYLDTPIPELKPPIYEPGNYQQIDDV